MTKQANSSASARPRRTALDKKNRLTVKHREPGYDYRVVNIRDDRVEDFIERGWEVCAKESVGAIGDRRVDNPSSLGSAAEISVGQGQKAVLMRIKSEWLAEDRAVRQAEIDALEQTMGKDKSDYGRLTVGSVI